MSKAGPREHGGNTEVTEVVNRLSERVIGAAIEVHRILGPGLLESAYQRALAYSAQVLTYLKFTGCHIGLVMNFRSTLLTHGLRRLAL